MKFLNFKYVLLSLLLINSSYTVAHGNCDCEERKEHSMNLRGVDPFTSMHHSFQRRVHDMEQLFNSMAFGSFGGFSEHHLPSSFKKMGIQTRNYDQDDHKIIEILASAGDSSDINVEVKGDMITISVNEIHKNSSKSDSGNFSESSFQSVSKKLIPVPEGVISEQVKIENQDGKLILKFPKKRV